MLCTNPSESAAAVTLLFNMTHEPTAWPDPAFGFYFLSFKALKCVYYTFIVCYGRFSSCGVTLRYLHK